MGVELEGVSKNAITRINCVVDVEEIQCDFYYDIDVGRGMRWGKVSIHGTRRIQTLFDLFRGVKLTLLPKPANYCHP